MSASTSDRRPDDRGCGSAHPGGDAASSVACSSVGRAGRRSAIRAPARRRAALLRAGEDSSRIRASATTIVVCLEGARGSRRSQTRPFRCNEGQQVRWPKGDRPRALDGRGLDHGDAHAVASRHGSAPGTRRDREPASASRSARTPRRGWSSPPRRRRRGGARPRSPGRRDRGRALAPDAERRGTARRPRRRRRAPSTAGSGRSPRPSEPLLALDDQQAFAGEDEEVLLRLLAVVHAARLARAQDADVDAELAEAARSRPRTARRGRARRCRTTARRAR